MTHFKKITILIFNLIHSSFFLLISGLASLYIYFFLWLLAKNLLGNKLASLLNLFPERFQIIQLASYYLFFFFALTLFWAIRQSQKGLIKPIFWFWAIFFFFSFSFILITTPPLTSQDVFLSLFHGRIFSYYRQNPYLVAPQNFLGDPFSESVQDWLEGGTCYGPIWTLLVSAISFLFPNSFFLQLLSLRIFLLVIFCLLIIFLIKIIYRHRPNWAFPLFILLAWQPFLLIETINNAHFDILVGFTVLLGLYFVSQNHYLKGFMALWLGFLLKYIPLLLLPLGIRFLFSQKDKKTAFQITLKTIAIIVLLTIIAYLPFGYSMFQPKTPFGRSSSLNIWLLPFSPFFSFTNLPPIPFFSTLLGMPILGIALNIETISKLHSAPWFNFQTPIESLANTVRFLSLAIYLIFYLWLIFRPFQDKRELFKRGFWILALYLLICAFWFMAWHLIWAFPLAIAAGLLPTLIILGWSLLSFPYPFPALYYGSVFVLPLILLAKSLKKIIKFNFLEWEHSK